MCGISGILSFNEKNFHHRLKYIDSLLAHRGKDASGILCGNDIGYSKNIYFAHRRLSILDLSQNANQPYIDDLNKNMIIYNGEIYNFKNLRNDLIKIGYRFKTHSDTEVLLKLYNEFGIEFVEKLEGMFSFAIWDERKKLLFCVRDEFGVKPFYYKIKKDSFEFASESRALYESESLNNFSVSSFFLGMYSPFGESIYENIKTLKPGHQLIIQNNKIEISKYYSLEKVINKNKKPNQFILNDINNLFHKSVKDQLISDKKISLSLSGGNDSTSIFFSILKSNVNFSSISIGYENCENLDLLFSKNLSHKYGIKNYNHIISNSESFDLIIKSITSLSEPVSDSSIVPTYQLSKISKDINCQVMLSGVGGDEVFLGYDRYIGTTSLLRYFLFKFPKTISCFIEYFLHQNSLNKSRLQNRYFDNFISSGGSKKIFELLNNNLNYYDNFKKNSSDFLINKNSFIQEFIYFDLISYLPNLLLNFYDQITMRHTIEGRVPFINKHLIEASYSLDVNSHTGLTKNRIVFNKSKINPINTIDKKMGFSGPVKNWVSYNFKKFKDIIMSTNYDPYLKKDNLEKIISDYTKTGINYNEIYSLLVFGVWKNSIK